MPIEFQFTATPDLGAKATRYLLWRRGGLIGPVAIVVLTMLLVLMAFDPEMRPIAYLAGGATLMLFLLVGLALAHRRRIRRRFFDSTSDHTIHVLLDEAGMAIKSAGGSSRLPWSALTRMWAGKEVILVFYHGWQYVAFPTDTVPAPALELLSSRIKAK